ncbi:MAG: twin arginine-targeting protein translocase TatC [Thiobacillus sp. 63-78]|uniref:twin-arginine translocase subunit TatC n=1 Tax=Thiobacillus sp. 63-78 TaxID=1895859 RepID=UPI00086DCB25|nr:twin-arginine translocase subunit TatC [Thiobacillus sp. 63-78]MBN8762990.1 twin-arginine translocase subunit TatC [Thiobacillus sp.]MBN8774602.1 twin-arginine translocase subunit TatC [Thiobacillus sp.]ODV13662.1 MAG: twin arginine-targeting protein translocase TatC [Thiobacillus sp. SCN 64-317]OJZ14543.1 MAG: twin arginine-targeting protein translocase TatC [Thiobacillus sp. 63-78]
MSDTEDTFISHLIEMRNRLLRAMLAIVIIFVCLFPWAQDIYALLARPLLAALPKGGQMIATEITTPFFVPMKVTLMAAFLLALPWVFYQAWAFVAPGLYQHEKRIGVPLVIASIILFLTGMAFAYFLVFPLVFHFIVSVTPTGVAVMTDIGKYLDFVLTMFMAFGITFEVPIAVVLLVKMGMVSVAKLREIRPYVIVGAFVIGAIFTPPDVISQFMLATPLWVLYEIGIIVAAMISKPRPESGSDYAPMSDSDMDDEFDRIETEQAKPDSDQRT